MNGPARLVILDSPESGEAGASRVIEGESAAPGDAGAVLRARGDGWFLQARSPHSQIAVEGHALEPRAAARLEPGLVARAGDRLFSLLPPEWLWLVAGNLFVYGPVSLDAGFVLIHCGGSLAGPLTARNLGERRLGPHALRLAFEWRPQPREIPIPPLKGAESANLAIAPSHEEIEWLRGISGPGRSRLTATISGSAAEFHAELRTFGPRDWPCTGAALRWISAYIPPWDPHVEKWTLEAAASAAPEAGKAPPPRTGAPRAALAGAADFLELLYNHLRDHHRITYHAPRTCETGGAAARYQRIPPAAELLRGGGRHKAHATCLDLALLFAAAMERIERGPLVIFTGEEANAPSHALAGAWARGAPSGRPVLRDRREIEALIAGGRLLVFEATGVCGSAAGDSEPPRGGPLTFALAREAGERTLRRAAWAAAVDVAMTRPPYGRVTPMDSPFSPEVSRAFQEAARLARIKGRDLVETSNLLFGLLMAGGEITRWLLEEFATPAESIAGHMLERARAVCAEPEGQGAEERGSPAPPRAPRWTTNAESCRDRARRLASEHGSPWIGELELWWALIECGLESEKFKQLCMTLGLHPARLRRRLRERGPASSPPPRIDSYTSWPGNG